MFFLFSIVQEEPSDKSQIEELLIRIGGGSEKAFRDLYLRKKSSVYTFALSMLRDSYEAEDVMQETFLKIREAAGAYESRGNGNAWIMQICKNLCLMKLRRKKNDSLVELTEEKEPGGEFPGIEDTIILKKAFQILSPQDTKIVVLHVVAGLKHREIADLLEMPLSTILAKYHRALVKLRKRLEEAECNMLS